MADPRQLGAAWVDEVNRQDLDALAAVLDPSFVRELGASSTEGSEASIEAWRLWFAAFPDFRFETLQVIAEERTVCLRLRMSGTHLGPLRFRGVDSMTAPIAPTGRSFDLPGCAVHDVEDGRLRRLYAYWDTATLLRQIGVL